MGAISGFSTPVSVGLAVPSIATVDITSVNSEQTFAFPVNTKHFKIYNDGKYIAKLAYLVTESGTNYYPIFPGDEHQIYNIVAPNVTIYVQSPGLITLRLEIWT